MCGLVLAVRAQVRSPLRQAARIASAQHGVITYRELLGAGVSRQTVGRWARKGLLHRAFRGVYRLGHAAPSVDATYLAAVRACGNGGALSGAAALHAHQLQRGAAPPPEVTVMADRRVAGVVVRRARRLDPADTTTVRGIPITTVARTLVDAAAFLSLDALARACHEADVRHRIGPDAIAAALARRPGVAGAGNLRAIIEGDHPLLLSRLERAFRAFLRRQRLPLPKTNRRRGRRYVDCRWAKFRLTVELDGYTFHRTRHAWEDDRQREREARARGDEFRRYTWRDVVEDQRHMRRDLAALLAKPQR